MVVRAAEGNLPEYDLSVNISRKGNPSGLRPSEIANYLFGYVYFVVERRSGKSGFTIASI